MTLEDAILHCIEQAKDCTQCAEEHYQLAIWLKELQEYRKLAKDNKLINAYMYSDEKVF